MLHKKKTNELFDLISQAGLHTNDFLSENYQDAKGSTVVITHKPSKYVFKMRTGVMSKGSVEVPVIRLSYTPDTTTIIFRPDKERVRGGVDHWPAVAKIFAEWLSLLKEETELPDLWAEAAKTAQLFAPTATPSDDKFTRAELAEVQGQLRLLQQSLTTAALPEVARQKLIELTRTAAVKAEGLTKKDWQNWIIGGFISAITALALNPTQAAEVLKLVKTAFGGLFLH